MNKKELIEKLQEISRLFYDADCNVCNLTIEIDEYETFDDYQFWYNTAQEKLGQVIDKLEREQLESEN